MSLDPSVFESRSASVCREYKIQTYLPVEDVSKTLKAVTEIVPLQIGSYENVAFHSQPGVRKFRPIKGSHLGDSSQVLNFSVVELTFSIPHDEEVLTKVVDGIFEAHIAEEPVIYIEEIWSTRAKSYSEKSNPNRFWNREIFKDESKW